MKQTFLNSAGYYKLCPEPKHLEYVWTKADLDVLECSRCKKERETQYQLTDQEVQEAAVYEAEREEHE